MGRKRRKSRPPILATALQEEDFHRPFSEAGEKLRKAATRSAPTPYRQAPDPMPGQTPADERARREKALFLSEMAGVTPLPKDPRGQVDKPRPRRRVSVCQGPDALDELRDLVAGRGAFSIQCTDEYMEGVAPGVDHRLAQRLHRGDFVVQAQCDLHGHTVEEAKVILQAFRDAGIHRWATLRARHPWPRAQLQRQPARSQGTGATLAVPRAPEPTGAGVCHRAGD